MRHLALSWVPVLLLTSLGALGPAAAESGEESSSTRSLSPEGGSASLSPDQKLKRAEAIFQGIGSGVETVERMLRDARRDHDVVKTICLDDKLSQLEVAQRTAHDRVDAMSSAQGQGNVARVDHDFAVMEALEERSNALLAEANLCIGKESARVGGSSLEVVFDPEIPNWDVSEVLSNPLISSPPIAASPTF